MSRSTRSSLLALLSAGLLTLGATGCFSPEALEAFAAEARSAESQIANDGAEGVTETLAGEVTYLAPGEYIVNDQAFYVAEDTRILGGLYACAPETPGAGETGTVECSFDEFDAALKDGTVVLAEVEIVGGIAETITEYQA
ncbi:hypothetical protein CQJ94_18840 [Glycomyces fuscus]|nr:hypothetical protein CQJ94_18840 [Glycomyces fuscus]